MNNELILKFLQQTGSNDLNQSVTAVQELAVAAEPILREGIQAGDIVSDIFREVPFAPNAATEFELDPIAPGTEGDYTAYTISGPGRIPERRIEGDYVTLPTFSVGNSCDWLLKYARASRIDVFERAMRVLRNGFTKKINDLGWHVVLSAALDRNILMYDSDAAAGNFTKRLMTMLSTTMSRNGGGNSSSVNHKTLTDLYFSLESMDDIRTWGVDQIDEISRREIFASPDGTVSRLWRTNLRPIYELGVGQEYQLFLTSVLGGALQAADVELVIGLDLSNKDALVMPTRGGLEVFPDPMLHRYQKAGMYGWRELGFGLLDQRIVIAGSY